MAHAFAASAKSHSLIAGFKRYAIAYLHLLYRGGPLTVPSAFGKGHTTLNFNWLIQLLHRRRCFFYRIAACVLRFSKHLVFGVHALVVIPNVPLNNARVLRVIV